MSGIFGVFYTGSEAHPPLNSFAESMCDALKHRGGEWEQFLFLMDYKNVVSAHRNAKKPTLVGGQSPEDIKSIPNNAVGFVGQTSAPGLWVDSGVFPYKHTSQKIWVFFDGTISNAEDLRADLKKQGLKPENLSTAALIATAYERYGEFITKHLQGSWSFVILDFEKSLLYASRDRFGIKPLYFHKGEEWFAFASELKALLKLPFIPKKLNREKAFEYLVNGTLDDSDETLFQGITELQPASSLHFLLQEKAVKIWHYYYLDYKADIGKFDEEKFKKYAQKSRKLILGGLKTYLQPENRIATMLSGGLASSSIVCLLDKLSEDESHVSLGKKLTVLTSDFSYKGIESKYQREVIEQVAASEHKAKPSAQYAMESFEKLTYFSDLPIITTAEVVQNSLLEVGAQAGANTILHGGGTDELFAGKSLHFYSFMRNLWKAGLYGEWMKNFMVANNKFANRPTMVRELMKYSFFKMAEKDRKRFLKQTLFWEYEHLRHEFWDRYKKKILQDEPAGLNTILHEGFTGHENRSLLRIADRQSAVNGVNLRMPFIENQELVEYVFNITSIYKIRFAQGKILLRAAMGNTLPEKVLRRRDRNYFEAPSNNWLLGNKNQLLEYITPEIRDLYDVKALAQNWDKLVKRADSQGSERLWRMIYFAIWRKVYSI